MTTTPALPHNEYKIPDGATLRLLNDDVLVQLDPLQEKTSGGIHIPDTAGDRGNAGILTTGTIVAYGFTTLGDTYIDGEYIPFQRIPIRDLHVGLKAAFIRFYQEQHTNKQIQHIIGKDVIRLKPIDMILVFDPEDSDRVLR